MMSWRRCAAPDLLGMGSAHKNNNQTHCVRHINNNFWDYFEIYTISSCAFPFQQITTWTLTEASTILQVYLDLRPPRGEGENRLGDREREPAQ